MNISFPSSPELFHSIKLINFLCFFCLRYSWCQMRQDQGLPGTSFQIMFYYYTFGIFIVLKVEAVALICSALHRPAKSQV